jgi:hypothetical protein
VMDKGSDVEGLGGALWRACDRLMGGALSRVLCGSLDSEISLVGRLRTQVGRVGVSYDCLA